MTEEEWRACGDPQAMLEFLRPLRTRRKDWRKFWLFSCACCRRIWHLLEDERCRRVVELGELYADGRCSYDDLTDASEEAFCRRSDLQPESVEEAAALATFPVVVDPTFADNMTPQSPAEFSSYTAQDVLQAVQRSASKVADRSKVELILEAERRSQADLIRCVFAPPFRKLAKVSPAILGALTALVPNMPQTIYEERIFGELAILADALEDAGCTDDDLLSHLRSPGPHVRGCWALDLLLGKE